MNFSQPNSYLRAHFQEISLTALFLGYLKLYDMTQSAAGSIATTCSS